MNLTEIGKAVAKHAPLLGAAIAGPGGAAIGAMVANAFGSDIAHLEAVIQSDPNAALKLKEIESNEIIARLNAEVADRSNARNREIQIQDKTPSLIAKLFIGGYFSVICLIIFAIITKQITVEEVKPITDILEKLSLAVMLILTYYFGKSYVNS